MSGHERRRKERHAEDCLVRAVIADSTELSGQAVDLSEGGVLFTANRLRVLVSIKGKHYRGRLVRAAPCAGERTQYAVELEELIGP